MKARAASERATPADSVLSRLGLMSSGDLATGDYRHEWLVKHVLVRGQTCILGGPLKTLKTSILIDLALSVGGQPTALQPPSFLGRFAAPPRPLPVLFFCAESGPATIQETARRVGAARGIDLARSLVHWSLKVPRIDRESGIADLARAVKATGSGLVIIDPLYLCLGGDANIANLTDIGGRLTDLAAACTEHGATLVLAHHARKHREAGRRFKPMELDELSFAGVAEFTRQWILVSRRSDFVAGTGRHELWLNVGGSAGASGVYAADFVEGQLGDDFTGRTWEVAVRQADEARAQAETALQAQQEAKAERQLQLDMLTILAHLRLPAHAEGDSNTGIAAATEISRKRTAVALARLIADGQVLSAQIQKGKRTADGYKIAAHHVEVAPEATAARAGARKPVAGSRPAVKAANTGARAQRPPD